MKRLFFSLIGLLLIVPIGAFAIELNLKYPSFGGIDLARDQDINQLVAYVYYFIVGISGLAAFVMIVWGGMQWLSSSGNPAQISDAKDRLKQALLGLLLVFSSFLILRVVNPDLVLLRSPALQTPPDQSRPPSSSILPEGAPSASVTSSLFNIFPGESVTLTWSGSGTGCAASSEPNGSLWSGSKPFKGNEKVGPINTTTTFRLACSSATQGSISSGITVNIGSVPPGTASPSANIDIVSVDLFGNMENVLLHVVAENVIECRAEPPSGSPYIIPTTSANKIDLEISFDKSPGKQAVFGLRCRGPGGAANREVTVN